MAQKYYIFCLYLFTKPMIEEFHKILRTPRPTPSQNLERTQDLILCSFQQIFPQTLDMQSLHKIFEEVLGPKAFPNQNAIQISLQQQVLLNCRLIEQFIELTKMHFENMSTYRALEEQTQRAEATIRSHIKVEQEMKMYLEYLEAKIQKMQRQLSSLGGAPEHLRRELQIFQSREYLMQRQKIGLIKKNEKLKNQIQILRRQLQSQVLPRVSIRSSFIANREDGQKQVPPSLDLEMSVKSSSVKHSQNPEQKTSEKERRDSFLSNHHNNNVTQKKRSMYFPQQSN